jgi:hypothetical protein
MNPALRIVRCYRHPPTGLACVSRLCTDLAATEIDHPRVAVCHLFGTDLGWLLDIIEMPRVDGTRPAPAGDPRWTADRSTL